MSNHWNFGPNMGVAEPLTFSGAYTEITPISDAAGITVALRKVEGPGLACANEQDAWTRAGILDQYVETLRQLNVPMAKVGEIGVVPVCAGRGWSVAHTMEYVPGKSLYDLAVQQGPSSDVVRRGLIDIIAMVCRMPRLADEPGQREGRLVTGVDLSPPNLRQKDGGFVLIDVDPPLFRGRDGQFLVEISDYLELTGGTVPGAIAQLLVKTYRAFMHAVRGQTDFRIDGYIDEWQELIPEGMHASVARALEELAKGYQFRIDEGDLQRLGAGGVSAAVRHR